MRANLGTEIMASSVDEALNRYEALGGESIPCGDGSGEVFVRMPDGFEMSGWIESMEVIRLPDSTPEDGTEEAPLFHS